MIMDRIVKCCSNHLLAHLYEHIYFISLDTILRRCGFFSTIDYSIDAYTEDGEIIFNIETYADIAIENIIEEATTQFLHNEAILDIAINQLESEHGKSLVFHNINHLKDALHELNAIKWNTKSIHKVDNSILSFGDKLELKTLQVTCSYSGIDQKIKPLYRQVAGITLNIFMSDLADTYGGFVASETYKTNEQKDLIGSVVFKDYIDKTKAKKLFRETRDELSTKGGYKRLLSLLQNISQLYMPPSSERTYNDTGVYMNEKKWRLLATQQNLRYVLDKLHCEIKDA